MRLFFTQSVFAGLLIGIAGLVFLQVGGLDEGRGFGELAGAVLFAFGLMSVSVSKALLFTGKAGYLPYKESLQLIPMVLFNAVGCLLMACIAYYTINENAMETLNGVMVAREAASWRIAITSVGTGVIVTMALQGVRKGTYFPLLYGVPFKLLIVKLGLCKPKNKVSLVLLVSVLLNALANSDLKILLAEIVENIVLSEL